MFRRGKVCLISFFTMFLILLWLQPHHLTYQHGTTTTGKEEENKRKSKNEYILQATREEIENSMLIYNFSTLGVKKMDNLLFRNGGKPVINLIISSFRSGTNFLGDILNSVPSTFYHYEPLFYYGAKVIRAPPASGKALKIIKSRFKCNFYDVKKILKHDFVYKGHLSYNTRLWRHCKWDVKLCLDENFVSKFCMLFPFQVMKVDRMRLHLVEELLLEYPTNLKVILLIRDPRGVMQSRQHVHFCASDKSECSEPAAVCSDLVMNYQAASRLNAEYPGRLIVLRFEDLALQPELAVQQLFHSLGLHVSPGVQRFLQQHTNKNEGDQYSTFRVSKQVPFKWKYMLTFDYVRKLQESCKDAMQLWGYRLAHNASHMESRSFYPLDSYSINA